MSSYCVVASPVRLSATPWTVALQASLSFTLSRCWLKFIDSEIMHRGYLFNTHSPLFFFYFLEKSDCLLIALMKRKIFV